MTVSADTLLLAVNLLVVGILSFFTKSWFVGVKERLDSHSDHLSRLERKVSYLEGLRNGESTARSDD